MLTIWLRSTRILRIDETTVSTSLRGGRARSGGAGRSGTGSLRLRFGWGWRRIVRRSV